MNRLTLPLSRRAALALAGVATAATLPPAAAQQDALPSSEIHLVVGFSPGSNTDLLARVLAEALQPRLKRPVRVENRPGAGGAVATEAVMRAAPNGATLGFASPSLAMAPHATRSPLYDPRADLTWISIFAARHPVRVRTLTLTNCDVHDQWPPAAVLPTLELARAGQLAGQFRRMVEQPERARELRSLGACYADPSALTDAAVRVYLEPITASEVRAANMHRYWTSFDVRQTVEVEPLLRRLSAPTLIVWAADDIFFDLSLARWLRDTIPGVVRLIEVPEAKLFFPEDQPAALTAPLRELWASGARVV
jgi:hypothetical protein